MKKIIILIALLFLIPLQVSAKHLYKEAEYQRAWAKKYHARVEYKLSDKTRVDCLTKTYAVEVEFAQKWAESIGQSLYYALMTKRKPAVVLIIENPKTDYKYLKRLRVVAKKHNITVFTITPKDVKLIKNKENKYIMINAYYNSIMNVINAYIK